MDEQDPTTEEKPAPSAPEGIKFTAEQQAHIDSIISGKYKEFADKYKDYDQLKAAKEERDALLEAAKTEEQKKADAAERTAKELAEARAELAQERADRLATQELAKLGVTSTAAFKALKADLKFNEKGELDVDVAALAADLVKENPGLVSTGDSKPKIIGGQSSSGSDSAATLEDIAKMSGDELKKNPELLRRAFELRNEA